MKEEIKNEIVFLIERLIHYNCSEEEDRKMEGRLDEIIKDPHWVSHIFLTNDYNNPDGGIDYEKFFRKIESYIPE